MNNEELAEAYQKGNSEALERLYFENIGLIRKTTAVYIYRMEEADILQESFFAVEKAARTYNSANRGNFATWLIWWLRGHLNRITYKSGVYVIPFDKQGKYRRYERILSEYKKLNGCEPEKEVLCYLARITASELEEMQRIKSAMNPKRLDREVNEDTESTFAELVPDYGSNFAEEVIEAVNNEQLGAILWGMVEELPEGQADVIRRIYQDEQTMKDISDQTGKPCETVRMEKEKALRKLRAKKHRLKDFTEEYIETKSISLSSFGFFTRYGSSVEFLALDKVENET